MIQGFKKGDLVVHPNVPQVLRVSSISGPFAFLLSAAEGFHVGEFPLAHLQLASEFCPEARDFRAGDIVIHEGEEAHVDRAKNGKLWVNDRRKVHIVDKYRVRRAPIDVGNWVRVCATGLVGMVTSRDPSYVRAFTVSSSEDAYHERELARTTEPAPVGPMTVPPDDIQVNDILLYRSLPDNEFAIVEVRVSSIIDDTYLLEGENGRIYGCREPANMRRAPIRDGDWVRTPNGHIWVRQKQIEKDGLNLNIDFYPWAVVHRIARPVLKPVTWREPPESRDEERRPLTRRASVIPFGDDDDTLRKVAEASNRAFASAGHVGAQQSSPPMIEVTDSVESQIEAMRNRLARLRNMDAKISFHLKGRVDPIRPWSLDGSTVRINVSRDIDLEDFVSRYANFREVAPPEFIYEVQFSETETV